MNIEEQKKELETFFKSIFPPIVEKDSYRVCAIQNLIGEFSGTTTPINIGPLFLGNKMLNKLNNLNNIGDCIGSTILFSRNSYFYKQTTIKSCIKEIHSVLIESDTMEIEKQKQFFIDNNLMDYVLCMVDTGNKSIHTYLKFELLNTNPIPKQRTVDNRFDRMMVSNSKKELIKLNHSYDITPSIELENIISKNTFLSQPQFNKNNSKNYSFREYDTYIKLIEHYFKSNNFDIDTKCLTCNQLSRLPTFRHNKSKNYSKLIYSKPYSEVKSFKEFLKEYEIKIKGKVLVDSSNATVVNSIFDLINNKSDYAIVVNNSSIDNDIESDGASDGAIVDIIDSDIDCFSAELGASDGCFGKEKGEEEEGIKTNVPTFQKPEEEIRDNNAIIDEYMKISKVGFEAGKRVSIVGVLLKYYAMLHFSIEDAKEDLIKILMIKNETTKSNEEIVKHLEQTYIPAAHRFIDISSFNFPEYKNRRIKLKKSEFKLLEYIFNTIKDIPAQNQEGRTGLSSRKMNEINKGYGKMIYRFKQLGILEETNSKYCPGLKTKQFKVFTPMLCWVIGLK